MAGRRHDKKGGQVESERKDFARRDFLKRSRDMAIGLGVAAVIPGIIWLDDALAAIPASGGYLLVDTKKCQGCISCMLACSLVHEGVESQSLSRIQIIQNPFEAFPEDVAIEQCRQCVDPACVTACPVDALKANPKFGNVRMVDRNKCIGCGACFEECPYTPSRPVVVADERYNGKLKSRKCDLCANTPYHWDDAGGGPSGKQACIEVCPVGAIKLTKKIPPQKGDAGYNVNLRGSSWSKLGYPSD